MALPLVLRVVVFSFGIVRVTKDERWAMGKSSGQFKVIVSTMLTNGGRRATIEVDALVGDAV